MQYQTKSSRPASGCVNAQTRYRQFALLFNQAGSSGHSHRTAVVAGDFNVEGQTSADSNECLKPIFEFVPDFPASSKKEKSE